MEREQYRTKRILAKNLYVSNNSWESGLNNNDLIIGPSGAGKTRGYVRPNLRLGNESMVVADTKGVLYSELKEELEEKGYEVLNIDFTNLAQGSGYNPLDFVRYQEESGQYNEQDIMTIAAGVVPVHMNAKDPFWDTAAQGVLDAVIAFVLEALPEKMHTFEYVGKIIDRLTFASISGTDSQEQVRGKNQINIEAKMQNLYGKEKSERDYMEYEHLGKVGPIHFADLIYDLEKRNPESYAVKMYRSQILPFGSTDKTFDSVRAILNTEVARMSFKSAVSLYNREPKIDMKELGKRKVALFLTVSDTDRSQDKLVNVFYTQLFQELCRSADQDYENHCLPVPVRIYLDDFATNIHIEDFDKIISVIRSREIYVSIILQSITQLEAFYGSPRAETIINNCDHCLYLGGQDLKTAEFVSMKTDKPLITILNMPLDHVYLFERGREAMDLLRYREESEDETIEEETRECEKLGYIFK